MHEILENRFQHLLLEPLLACQSVGCQLVLKDLDAELLLASSIHMRGRRTCVVRRREPVLYPIEVLPELILLQVTSA